MLDKQTFLKGMQQLGLYYKNFSLTKEESNIWYLPFKDFTEEEFKYTLVTFMKHSIYSPNNPTQILKPGGMRIERLPDCLRPENKYIEHDPTEKELKDMEETQKLLDEFK